MVDSIMDNLSLQTQRRAFVQLELHEDTPHESVNQFVLSIDELMQKRRDKVESYTVFFADIVKSSYIVTVEFFTATIPVADFNELRQYVNLNIAQIRENLNIRLSSSGKDPH
jgi:MscS family membrane protein